MTPAVADVARKELVANLGIRWNRKIGSHDWRLPQQGSNDAVLSGGCGSRAGTPDPLKEAVTELHLRSSELDARSRLSAAGLHGPAVT